MYLPDEPDEDFELNIVPMIDVIFAILTFFIISSLFLTRSESLPVNLPDATSAERQSQTRLIVTIDASGALFLNKNPVALETLQREVQQQMEPTQKAVIVIHADEAVRHGRVIAVMDTLRTIEGATLGIATEQPE
jgi:biopolymer transport protein ExbD